MSTLRLAGALWIIAGVICAGLLVVVFVGENLLAQNPGLSAMVLGGAVAALLTGGLLLSRPGPGVVRWSTVLGVAWLLLRIPVAHDAQGPRKRPDALVQSDHRLRRRGRARHIPGWEVRAPARVSKAGHGDFKPGTTSHPATVPTPIVRATVRLRAGVTRRARSPRSSRAMSPAVDLASGLYPSSTTYRGR